MEEEVSEMIVRFVIKDCHIWEEVQQKMEKKLHQRLDAYYRQEAEDTSTVVVKITENKRVFKVEINMPFAGHQLRTENEERENPMPALDKGIDLLERQMRKHKTRMTRSLRQERPVPAEEAPQALAEDEEGNGEYRVVKVKQYESKPMSVQDAIFQMDLLGHTFFTFLNAETGAVCTAYRRNDGDYGLIELANL